MNRDRIEEIKSKLDIVAVIERDVSLHKESDGSYTGATSVDSKSGSSLKVDQLKQVFHNFATGEKGDVLDWLGRDFNDPRGADFPEIIRIAAALAGIELEEMTEEERNAAKEKTDIHNLFTEAVEIYHKNLTPAHYDLINEKWGITKETVDRLKIGYAIGEGSLDAIWGKPLLKSGLVYLKDDHISIEIFKGRIIFPYWNTGKVVYLIGRETEETPAFEREKGMKYKKLLVHKEKQEYVSPSVQNSYFYGEDSLRGFDYCIITEGVADCIVMLQAGFPCISPVTVQFREKDHPKLISLTKGLKTVYICNDNEASGAGIKGALKTAEALEGAGIEVKIIELPKPASIAKIDIADYMKGHSKDDFQGLMDSSERLWTYKLSKQKVPVTKLDRRKAFEDFISNDLKGMPYTDWELFVTNDATKHFGLTKKDAKPTIDEVRGLVKEFDYDLDSVSGRNAIYRAFADEYIKKHHVKCINGKLRLYKDGVYPDSDEAIEFIQSEIMNIGLSHGVNLAETNITVILRLIELSTRVRMADCEPNTDSIIIVNNGILHLDTWELEEFSSDKIYFSKIPVDYLPDAPKPTIFYNYVDSCFKGNEAQKELLQEMFGYSLLKNYKYQYIFYLLGHGGNGKGIALSILGYLLGEHNYASESIHQLTDHLHVDYHVAKLHGKHVNICGDIGAKTIVNTETIKKLTSNTDPVAARNPYERPFNFINYAKIIVALNRLPETEAFTTGDKRRNLIISFNNKFSETTNEIKGLQDLIRDSGEMPGILLWAIEGLKRLEANQKFSDTRTIAQRTVEYDRKSRPVRYYVEERLEEDSMNVVPNALIYDDFNTFCISIGAAELSQNEIKKSILQECREAGWDVTNRLTRIKSLPENVQKMLEEIGLKDKSLRCFYGLKIAKVKPPLTDLESDILRFKEGHQIYKNGVEEIDLFVNDMMSDYPQHEFM